VPSAVPSDEKLKEPVEVSE